MDDDCCVFDAILIIDIRPDDNKVSAEIATGVHEGHDVEGQFVLPNIAAIEEGGHGRPIDLWPNRLQIDVNDLVGFGRNMVEKRIDGLGRRTGKGYDR